jgi:CHAD domain-containing protein
MPPAPNPLARHDTTLRKALYNILSKRKPKPEPIHQLRAILRRILAELSLLPNSPETAAHIARFTRLTKPIIKSAGKTRDLDVHVDLLEKLSHKLQPEIDSLARHLLKRRRRRAATLLQLVRKNQEELVNVFNKLQAVPPHLATPALASSSAKATISSPARTLARDTFSRAARTLNPNQPDQLHELRKAARDARYLAESAVQPLAKLPTKSTAKSAIKYPAPSREAAHFRHIQQAVGVWHDYLTLAESARRYLPASSPLIPALERLRNRYRRTALKTLTSAPGSKRPPKTVVKPQQALKST